MGLVHGAHRLPADLRAASGLARARPPRALRLVQGLALGGEYGGAATYVAEHVPDERRGYYTSFIQTTATLGFFLSLGVIGACRAGFGPEDFKAFGWRVPFLVSFVLLAVSLYIRLQMRESPLFAKLKTEGRSRRTRSRRASPTAKNLRYVLLALFGATAGQGVVWYTGQFYALTFLQKPLNLDWRLAYPLVAGALAPGHAVLRGLREALGPHRAQADHAGRLPAGRAHVRARSTWPRRPRQPGDGARA